MTYYMQQPLDQEQPLGHNRLTLQVDMFDHYVPLSHSGLVYRQALDAGCAVEHGNTPTQLAVL